MSRNKPLTKLCLNCPLHLKYVLALPWETWSARLSRLRNNEVHIWMINWMATNITGSYCLLSLKKSCMSHHVIFITVCAQNVRLQHKSKCIDAGATIAKSTFNNCVTQSGPLTVNASFQFVDIWDLGTIDFLLTNVKLVTDFQWFCGLTMLFRDGMLYQAWIHCCKRPNYDFCISQGSAATVLRWGGPNYGHLQHVSLWCCVPKIIEVGQRFMELFKK